MFEFNICFGISPFTFFKMEMEVYFDSVKFRESSFCIAPEVLDSIYMNTISFGEFVISMIYSEMSFGLNINKSIVSLPSITIDDWCIKIYLSLNDWFQSPCLTIRYNLCIDLYSSACILSFDQSEYWLFQSSSSSFEFSCNSSYSFRSEIAFINFNFSSYLFFKFLDTIKINYHSKELEVSINSVSIQS